MTAPMKRGRGRPPILEGGVRIGVRVPAAVRARLRALATRTRIREASIARECLEIGLRELEAHEPMTPPWELDPPARPP